VFQYGCPRQGPDQNYDAAYGCGDGSVWPLLSRSVSRSSHGVCSLGNGRRRVSRCGRAGPLVSVGSAETAESVNCRGR
jgi:hypothetical protein